PRCSPSVRASSLISRCRTSLCFGAGVRPLPFDPPETTRVRDDENLTAERPTFVTHLECAYTGERYPADEVHNLSRAGKPLLVRYDLDGVRKALSKEALARRPFDLWRYRELLPVRRAENIVSLGEAVTPLVRLPKLAR